MSDVLLAFARPLTAGIDDVPLIRSLLQVAAAVWNASSMAVPPEVILAKFDGDEEAKLLVNELIEARRTTYAEDPRMIEAVEVTYEAGNLHVDAAWSIS